MGGDLDVLTAGLIGGISWHSTLEYYRAINMAVARTHGGATSAKLVLVSLNFAEVLRAGPDESSGEHTHIYINAACALQRAGADFIVICSNTGHRRAEDIERATGLRVLHIADVTAKAVRAAGYSRIALLGTAATMEGPFIRARLERQWRLDVLLPDADTRSELNHLIMDEMSQGVFSETARAFALQVVDRLQREQGAQAAILGCTELPILLDGNQSRCPMFDTLHLHAEAAAALVLADEPIGAPA
jgi:aspartate racemase